MVAVLYSRAWKVDDDKRRLQSIQLPGPPLLEKARLLVTALLWQVRCGNVYAIVFLAGLVCIVSGAAVLLGVALLHRLLNTPAPPPPPVIASATAPAAAKPAATVRNARPASAKAGKAD